MKSGFLDVVGDWWWWINVRRGKEGEGGGCDASVVLFALPTLFWVFGRIFVIFHVSTLLLLILMLISPFLLRSLYLSLQFSFLGSHMILFISLSNSFFYLLLPIRNARFSIMFQSLFQFQSWNSVCNQTSQSPSCSFYFEINLSIPIDSHLNSEASFFNPILKFKLCLISFLQIKSISWQNQI